MTSLNQVLRPRKIPKKLYCKSEIDTLQVSWFLKVVFGILHSSKKRTKKFDLTTMIPQVDLFLFIFWKNLKAPKRHFEIKWPLVVLISEIQKCAKYWHFTVGYVRIFGVFADIILYTCSAVIWDTSGWLVFVLFLEEFEDTKKIFRN